MYLYTNIFIIYMKRLYTNTWNSTQTVYTVYGIDYTLHIYLRLYTDDADWTLLVLTEHRQFKFYMDSEDCNEYDWDCK